MSGNHLNYNRDRWVLDNGASHHMTPTHSILQDLRDLDEPLHIKIPTGDVVLVKKIGTVQLDNHIKLIDVLYIPQFSCNLISIHKLTCDLNCMVTYFSDNCVIQDQAMKRTIRFGDLCDGVYVLRMANQGSSLAAQPQDASVLWHARMGHPSNKVLLKMSSSLNFSLDENKLEGCDVCHRSKQCMLPFSISNNKAVQAFELIHCDLWGRYATKSHNGSHYFLTIVDDFTRAVWVYLIKEKSETPNIIINFCKLIERQFDKKVKIVRSDNGTEFTNTRIQSFFQDEGIVHQVSCVGRPQQNGRVKRKHRHILNVARALRFHANLPLSFWGECVLTATHIINRTPTSANGGLTPYEMLFGKTPLYDHLQVFGCLCYMKTPLKPNDKFATRAHRCVFVGYPTNQKGWRVYNLDTKKFSTSKDIIFYERIFPYAQGQLMHEMTMFPHNPATVSPLEDHSMRHTLISNEPCMSSSPSAQHEDSLMMTSSLVRHETDQMVSGPCQVIAEALSPGQDESENSHVNISREMHNSSSLT
uniref:Retrovirus-related Pol polyprotein from transposon TNT 1-94 n=1 Tax=Cajanus cajan TaxID=3821 RepID=A0A151TF42_CAJCA|nr:Retrovirus-related Pol polyprotein from transposon TNT 1-94 [Cajanus cajan]